MLILILFAFLAGVVTVLSPCILPLLPLILASTDTSGKQRPLGVIVGFIASFTFFTLFLSTIVRLSGVSADFLRFMSIALLAGFGVSLLVPWIQLQVELLFSRLANLTPDQSKQTGFVGGIVIGFSLGLLWTPCVGPILASVISLALTGSVTAEAFFITLAYAVGTAIPLFAIMLAGGAALKKIPWLVRNTTHIQKGFGVLMIITSVGLFYNLDRQFQAAILTALPQYGAGLTQLENNTLVKERLPQVKTTSVTAPEIIPGGQWFNSEPLQLSQLRGKVVMVDFWTYTCINCLRTIPHLKSWWSKYEASGLVIIGVHAPEFEFEKNPANVQKAVADFELKYPVVQDNNFATWNAYKNQYWPAKYLIDKDGAIRYTHFGEGDYDEIEGVIQTLLAETGKSVSEIPIEKAEHKNFARTPEIYLGYDRLQYIATPDQVKEGRVASYTFPPKLNQNLFALSGQWSIESETANPSANAVLELSFDAQEVFLVMRPKKGPSTVKVLVDGQPQFFGDDVHDGKVSVTEDRLYKLVKLPAPGKHILRLEFIDANAALFAFTFG